MQDNQIKAISWIKSGMNYISGIDLLVELTRKQTFYNLFTGKDIALADKLAYEICKAALLANQVTWKDFIREVQSDNIETENQPNDFPDVKISDQILNRENNPKICAPDYAETIVSTETIITEKTIVTTETTEMKKQYHIH